MTINVIKWSDYYLYSVLDYHDYMYQQYRIKNFIKFLVGLIHDPPLQVGENYSYLIHLRPHICESGCLNTYLILRQVD